MCSLKISGKPASFSIGVSNVISTFRCLHCNGTSVFRRQHEQCSGRVAAVRIQNNHAHPMSFVAPNPQSKQLSRFGKLIRCYNVKPPSLAYSGLHTVSLCSSGDECRRRQKRPPGATLVSIAAGTRTLSAALMSPCKSTARLALVTLY
jgi:hypothetical protein